MQCGYGATTRRTVTLALTAVDDEDAREVVALMDDVLSRAYQLPARTRRIIESREAPRHGN
jgi:hypothetical protein